MTKYTLLQEHVSPTQLHGKLRTINPVVLDILFNRGIRTEDEMESFLFAPLDDALQPLDCQDIHPMLDMLEKAVREKLPIVVYRDYDVDGITAGAVAVETLRALGAIVHHYANDRNVDGFGICRNGIDNILRLWPDTRIILTVDNGIVGVDAITYARKRGLTVLVTDHHEPGAVLPPAHAIVDLKRHDETYPFRELCGCGIIFRVIFELYKKMGVSPSPVLDTLDMVALATIADVVPLLHENRILVREGIKRIAAKKRPFFKAILELTKEKQVRTRTLSFTISPVLNALSRMGRDTAEAVEALLSTDEQGVTCQCLDFLKLNEERKRKTAEQGERAEAMLRTMPEDSDVVILYDESFCEGVIGITAGRLKDQLQKPTIVFTSTEEGVLKGSGRSTSALDLKECLDACSDLLLAYGGHKRAAGLSLTRENFPAFKERMMQIAKEKTANVPKEKEVVLSGVLSEETLTEDFVKDLSCLEPYGEGFEEPIFGLIARPIAIQHIGKQRQHVKLICSAGLSILAWNQANQIRQTRQLPEKFVGKLENKNLFICQTWGR